MRRLRALPTVAAAALALMTGLAHADCTTFPALCGLQVTSTIEQPDLDQAIDVVLVGDGFTDAATWASAAASVIANLKAQTLTGIYGTVPGLYNFHVVNVLSATSNVSNTDLTDTALGMNVSGAFITADMSRVTTAALNAPDVDVVVAVAVGSGRANAYYPTQLASGSSIRLGANPAPISHELGHALVHVADEYVESGLCSSRSEAMMLNERNVTADPTCVKFSTTPGALCVEGARYCATGIFRSSGSCLMSASGNAAMCPACSRALRDTLLEKLTGLDHAEPWAVPSNPLAGSTVAGKITLTAIVYDDYFPLDRVAFSVDGVFRGFAAATGGFSAQLPFDTTSLVDGSHTLDVFPDDAAGHAGHSPRLTFQTQNFNNAGSTVLSLSKPVSGDVVRGISYVIGAATDPTPLWLAVSIDGTPVAIALESKNISFPWDTTTATEGPHALQLHAADHRQALYASPVVNVTVQQAADGGTGPNPGGTGMNIYLSAPPSWSAIGPAFLLSYSVRNAAPPITPELWVDQHPILPNPLPQILGSTGPEPISTALIDSGGWSLGPHEVQVRASGPSGSARSNSIAVVRAAPSSNPVALLVSPGPRAVLRGQVSVEAVGYDDVSVVSLALLVDGAAVATQTGASATFSWNTTGVVDGSHTLAVKAVDGAGNHGESPTLTVTVDNLAPVVSITSPNSGATVPASLMPVLLSASDNDQLASVELLVDGAVVASAAPGGAVALPVVLAAGSRSLQGRATDRAGNTALSAAVQVTAANCSAGGCDDGKACTTDSCAATGACLHVLSANCCAGPVDCDDSDPCTTDSCSSALQCQHSAIAGCCDYGFTCDDGQLCTLDRCSGPGGTCSHGDAGCCASVADCDDGNPCTTDACLAVGWCAHDWSGACCRNNADCDDGNVCTTEVCTSGSCVVAPVPGCCNTGSDCDDGVLCTYNQCVNHACSNPPAPGCCAAPADCTSLNTCLSGSCSASHACQFTSSPGCCTFDFECDDFAPCTLDRCIASTCTHLPQCCTAAAQCDDQRSCTSDTCNVDAGICQFAPITNCCTSPADCDDFNACTVDSCNAGTCDRVPVPGCCRAAADCNDGDACTTDTCTAGTCVHAPCDDGNACTADFCDAGLCGTAPIAGCCQAAPECDDGNACTQDLCTANVCTHRNSCCTSPSQCDDGNLCTTDDCDAGGCVWAPMSGCCNTAADCSLDQFCENSTCVASPATGVVGSCGCTQTGGLDWGLVVLAMVAARGRRRWLGPCGRGAGLAP